MTNKSPNFPMLEPNHFSDYGFDPQIDYFQVLEEARKHNKKRETTTRSIDALHFKLQKPISKDDSRKIKKTRKRWWKNALHFFKWKRSPVDHGDGDGDDDYSGGIPETFNCRRFYGAHQVRALSGPVYITESRSGSTTPYRTTSRPSSGPLAGTFTPSRKGEFEIPYISLRDLNMEQPHRISASSPTPIYLVT